MTKRGGWCSVVSASKSARVVSPEGGDRMSVLEVIALLQLLATVIFGIARYIKK
nr:MAG TPA: hypothetical protein [Caudoviricetes sp.]